MRLTNASCRAAKSKAKVYKLSDGGGLQLWVHPTGAKTWRLAFRFERKQRMQTFGSFPEVSLDEARERQIASKRLLKEGRDPRFHKPSRQPPNPFGPIALEWHENERFAWKESHTFRVMRRLQIDILPTIGEHEITELTPVEILAVIRAVEARGAIDMGKRVRQTISSVFKYAIATGRATSNPSADLGPALKKPPRVKHRTFVRERELPMLLKAIDSYAGDPMTRLAVLFTMLTMVRSGETRFAEWREFENLDGARPLWRIPAERMKAGAEHIVPLSWQVVRLLREVKRLSRHSIFLFPSGRTRSGFMSENTMIYALYRMGYQGRATVHGFRSTASTILNETGEFNSDWIERQLAHVEQNQVRAAYNTAEWMPQRRRMMQWWADYLDEAGRR